MAKIENSIENVILIGNVSKSYISLCLLKKKLLQMNIQVENSHGMVWTGTHSPATSTSTVKYMHKTHWNGFYCKCRFSFVFFFLIWNAFISWLWELAGRACSSIFMCVSWFERNKKREEKCKWLRVKHAGKFAQATFNKKQLQRVKHPEIDFFSRFIRWKIGLLLHNIFFLQNIWLP